MSTKKRRTVSNKKSISKRKPTKAVKATEKEYSIDPLLVEDYELSSSKNGIKSGRDITLLIEFHDASILRVKVSSFVLSCKSDVFKSLFNSPFQESKQSEVLLKVPEKPDEKQHFTSNVYKFVLDSCHALVGDNSPDTLNTIVTAHSPKEFSDKLVFWKQIILLGRHWLIESWEYIINSKLDIDVCECEGYEQSEFAKLVISLEFKGSVIRTFFPTMRNGIRFPFRHVEAYQILHLASTDSIRNKGTLVWVCLALLEMFPITTNLSDVSAEVIKNWQRVFDVIEQRQCNQAYYIEHYLVMLYSLHHPIIAAITKKFILGRNLRRILEGKLGVTYGYDLEDAPNTFWFYGIPLKITGSSNSQTDEKDDNDNDVQRYTTQITLDFEALQIDRTNLAGSANALYGKIKFELYDESQVVDVHRFMKGCSITLKSDNALGMLNVTLFED